MSRPIATIQRPDYRQALALTGLLERLAEFDPHVAGTPPLGIAMPDSDIDVLCHAPEPERFARHLWEMFRDQEGFALRQWCGATRPVIAGFSAHGWEFEIFGQDLAVPRQAGYRHYLIEERLLSLGGEPLRRLVMEHRMAGAKTEPAFAAALGLPGDPYCALLALETEADDTLEALIHTGLLGRAQDRG